MARQKLGQHFLTDPGWREKIARSIGTSAHSMGVARQKTANSCWIEIGAGHGEMTRALAVAGEPVHSIELDPPLVRRLEDLAAETPNLTIVPGDVLKADFAAIAAGRRARIYGNLPYYITSPILHRLFQFADIIDEIHIVVQLEVAFRLAARPPRGDSRGSRRAFHSLGSPRRAIAAAEIRAALRPASRRRDPPRMSSRPSRPARPWQRPRRAAPGSRS